ncbi:MAG: hypothetical protein ACFCA4_05985 [Cyanophyceae cyanobacterium]
MLQGKSSRNLPPILLSWTVMTAIAAAIFGVIISVLNPAVGTDGPVRLMAGVLVGGLIVGGVEWGTLRAYRIPMSPLWWGLKPGVMLGLVGMMFALRENIAGEGFVWLTLWGLALDVTRWWLLRSHFANAKWWTLFCGLGWLIDTPILFLVGVYTIRAFPGIAGSGLIFIAFNGAVNGAWMGLCRGIALTMMMRDRQKLAHGNAAPAPSP